MRIVTAEQMKRLDSRTINEAGIPGCVLMENAGRGTAEHIRTYFPQPAGKRVVILCGRGNNGGDGFVIARYFFNEGRQVSVFLLSSIDRVHGDAKINLDAFRAVGGQVRTVESEQGWQDARSEVVHAGIIVDAMLGTGLSSEVSGLYRRIIEDVNALQGPAVVSVDVPSGLDATSGRILGAAVNADLTCTYGLPKRGLYVYPGASAAGRREVIDIGIPRCFIEQESCNEHVLCDGFFGLVIPGRRPDSHKGTYGHVCVLAGSPGKTGAGIMTARAAMRAGAGLVTLGVPESLNCVFEAQLTEAMTEPVPDSGKGILSPASREAVRSLIAGKSVIAVGPGLSQHADTVEFFFSLLKDAGAPLVVDADGLNILARDTSVLRRIGVPAVLTPHPGEMARLMGATIADVQRDRIAAARTFSADHGVIVVLKGAATVIADPGGGVYINTTGNPGMASGGMGDVLTGMIAGLAAQGVPLLESAQLSVFVHGRIGDRIAADGASMGILATDIIDRLPRALRDFVQVT